MINLRSIKTQLIIYLIAVVLFFTIKERDFVFLGAFVISVFTAVICESFILYSKTKAFKITESSIITGMIIGYVLSSDNCWWKIVFASLIAIFSKHLISFRKKHIFNPAAFGVLLSIVIFSASTQWKSTYLWYILVPVGIYFAQHVKKLEVIVGYTVISLFLFGTQALLTKVPLLNIFSYFSYFYIFIMLIEPKTTPSRTTGKYIFGMGVAVLIFILTEVGIKFDVELFSLLVMNALILLLYRIPTNKGGAI